MVVPSNDFFIGNNSATVLDLASLESAAPGSTLVYNLSSVYDAGTEVEDFSTSAVNGLLAVAAGLGSVTLYRRSQRVSQHP